MNSHHLLFFFLPRKGSLRIPDSLWESGIENREFRAPKKELADSLRVFFRRAQARFSSKIEQAPRRKNKRRLQILM
jgi:hypothetical protein